MSYPHKEHAALIRLHALVRKGYRPDLGVKNDTNMIRLEHPRGASAGAPDLLLCSDGLLIASGNLQPLNTGVGNPDCIYVKDEADWRMFESFLASVPKPTTFQELDAMKIWEARMLVTVR